MDATRLEALLSRWPGLQFVVLGDYFLDRYLDIDRALAEVSLETGLEAHQVVAIRNSPGAAGNVAANLAALGVRLGGTNSYQGRVEHRSELGDGRAVRVGDVRRAVRLTRMVGAVAAGVCVAVMFQHHRHHGS